MSKTDNTVFIMLQVVAWIIFVGLCIEAGGLLVNFVYSLYRPEFVDRLYNKLDLSQLYAYSQQAYYSMYSFMIVISVLKAVLFYHVIQLLGSLKLTQPFTQSVSKKIYVISYYTFSIGILSYIARKSALQIDNAGVDTATLNEYWADSRAFVLMAAVIYVIAVIFKKGIELQDEHDLTV